MTDALPRTIELINSGKTVLDTQRDSSSDIRRFSANLAELSEQIRSSDPDLRGVLDNGVVASREIDALLRENRPALPILLGNLITVGQIQSARLPGLREILVAYPLTVRNGFVVGPAGQPQRRLHRAAGQRHQRPRRPQCAPAAG